MVLSLFDLTGRTALVTGSSRGIGLGLAEGLAAAGARVVLNGRSADSLSAAVETLTDAGRQASASVFDVTDAQAAARALAAIEDEVAPVDILVNNAGMTVRGVLHELEPADWQRVLRTNLDSVYAVSAAVARSMIARGRGGAIINTCSVMSEVARPGVAAYAASKGAVKMLTKAMCADWAQHGIRVNGIGPGYFRTELTSALAEDEAFTAWLEKRTPLGRWGSVEELQGAAVFLASDAAGYVTGHILYVDGGMLSVL